MGHWRKQEISFFVTSECNLECPFCYIPKLPIRPEHRTIDLDFAEAGLRYFFTTNQSRVIRFFASGEPTQAFETMVEIHERAKRLVGDDLVVELQTNGCFEGTCADWVERNVDLIWISCDGPPQIQDSQRPMRDGRPSSPMVLGSIRRCLETRGMQVGVRATLMESNLSRQAELVEYFNSLGVRFVCAAPAYSSTANGSVTTPNLLTFSEHFVPAFYMAQKLGMFYQTHLMVNFDEPVQYYCRACTPCPQLTTDGYVSCCDWASFGPDYLPGPLQELIYGHYDKQAKEIVIDPEKLKRIIDRNVRLLAANGCSGCTALKNCGGGCLGKMIVETRDMYKATPGWCQAVRYLAEHLPTNRGLFPCLHS